MYWWHCGVQWNLNLKCSPSAQSAPSPQWLVFTVEHVPVVTNVQNYDFNLSDFYAASHTLSSQSKPFDIVLSIKYPQLLIRCKNYSSKDLPPVAAPNHIGLESKICESLNYFRYTSIRSFSNVLLEPESRAKLVGGQDGGLSEEHIFSSHHMFCIIFGQGLWKFSSRRLKFIWSTAMCSYMW